MFGVPRKEAGRLCDGFARAITTISLTHTLIYFKPSRCWREANTAGAGSVYVHRIPDSYHFCCCFVNK